MSPDGFLLGMAGNDYVGTHSLVIKVTDNSVLLIKRHFY